MELTANTPFDWPRILAFMAGRATPGVEFVSGHTYQRTLAVDGAHVTLAVQPGTDPASIQVSVTGNEGATKATVAKMAKMANRVFDLEAPLEEITAVLRRDDALAAMLDRNGGVRVPGAWDPFELTIRAILGQQISVKAATTIAGRIAQRYGEPVAEAHAATGLVRLFPTADRLSRARFNDIGIVRSRAQTIRDLSAAVVRGDVDFFSGSSAAVRRQLESIKGIGQWTSQYVAMRALKDADAFPGTDLGLVSAIAHPARVTPKELIERAESWRPFRAYAAMLLWSSLPGSGG